MSVLINMEMPTRCMDCPFMVSRDNDDCILQSAEANANFKDWDEMKASCPLIPIPPHGRLIDADALMHDTDNFIHKTMLFGGQYVYSEDAIKNAPTIIPPSEEGK